MRDHQRVFAPEKGLVQHDMNTLAGSNQWPGRRKIHPQHPIYENTCGVDHRTGMELMRSACFFITRRNARYFSVGSFEQTGYPEIIQKDTTFLRGRLRQIDRQATVVKLA